MDTISYTSAYANLANTMNKVGEDQSPIIITRKNGNPVVMISLEARWGQAQRNMC